MNDEYFAWLAPASIDCSLVLPYNGYQFECLFHHVMYPHWDEFAFAIQRGDLDKAHAIWCDCAVDYTLQLTYHKPMHQRADAGTKYIKGRVPRAYRSAYT